MIWFSLKISCDTQTREHVASNGLFHIDKVFKIGGRDEWIMVLFTFVFSCDTLSRKQHLALHFALTSSEREEKCKPEYEEIVKFCVYIYFYLSIYLSVYVYVCVFVCLVYMYAKHVYLCIHIWSYIKDLIRYTLIYIDMFINWHN